MPDELTLDINDQRFSGWTRIRVSDSIEQMASSFSVSFTERWNETGTPIPINEGDEVVVKMNGEAVLTGFVDDSIISYTGSSHTASVSGRSKTSDLVDCAAIVLSNSWKQTKINKIASDIARPFGIDVEFDASQMGKPFRKFNIQEGETGQEALERASRMRALMLMSTRKGLLKITRRGTRKVSTVLRYGRQGNVKEGSRNGSTRDRFTDYIGKIQIPGSDTKSGKDATITRFSIDDRVLRYRPTIIMAENEDTGKELQDRVTWERNRRAGQARTVSYVVQGWRDDSGDLWEPNTLVDVNDSFLRVRDEMLIVSVNFVLGNDGTTTSIGLAIPEAYDLIKLPPPKPAERGEDFLA